MSIPKKMVLVAMVFSLSLLFGQLDALAAGMLNPTPSKPITLKIATFFQRKDIRQKFTEKWGKAISKATNGAIKFRYFPAQSLVRAKEMADSLKSGIIDGTTFFVPAYTPEDFPFFAAITQIPFALPGNYEVNAEFKKQAADILYASFAKHNIKPLWSMYTSYGQEWFLKDKIDPKDLKASFQGKRIRSPGIVGMKVMIKWLGGERVAMSSTEVYEAGQKGIISGCTLGFSQYASNRMYEVFPNILSGNSTFTIPGGVPCVLRLNLWNRLPKEIQDKIVTVSEPLEKEFYFAYRKAVDDLREKLLKSGKIKQYLVMGPDQKAQWRKEISALVSKELSSKFPARYPKLEAIINSLSK